MPPLKWPEMLPLSIATGWLAQRPSYGTTYMFHIGNRQQAYVCVYVGCCYTTNNISVVLSLHFSNISCFQCQESYRSEFITPCCPSTEQTVCRYFACMKQFIHISILCTSCDRSFQCPKYCCKFGEILWLLFNQSL